METIEHFRKLLKMPKKELADAAGISASMYGRYLSGKSRPFFDTMVKLADKVGLVLDFGLQKRPK